MPHPLTLALVTSAEMPKPDPESHLLVAALARQGLEARLIPWDSPIDWSAFPLVVVRTPWDYFRRLPQFLAWAEQVQARTRLLNPSAVLAWNSHKRYLRQLAQQGLATVPTLWLEQGSADGAARLQASGWDEVVIKPAVSIGAIGALRGRTAEAGAQAHLQALLAAGDVMVQPFVDSVAHAGEVSLVFFGGRYSHAIRKQPKAGDYRVQDMYGGTVHPHQPSRDELALAQDALAATPAPTAYARVDLVRHGGQPALMELELIEPELFLGAAAGAADHFAQVLREHLDRPQ